MDVRHVGLVEWNCFVFSMDVWSFDRPRLAFSMDTNLFLDTGISAAFSFLLTYWNEP
jgi:hypothetical protein